MGMGMGMDVVSGALQSARDTASASMESVGTNVASSISSSVDSIKNTRYSVHAQHCTALLRGVPALHTCAREATARPCFAAWRM